MSQVILIGDPHLGKGVSLGKTGIGSSLNSRIADQINLLDWILDLAVERTIGHIIITGDVFEECKPHPSLIAFLLSWLKKCQVYQICVHVIMGNHDMVRSGAFFTSPLDIISEADLENVSVYKNIDTIFIGTTAFTLLPFRDRKSFSVHSNADALQLLQDSLLYEMSSIPATYTKIVVGHLAIEGSIPVGDEIDDITNELYCPLQMFNGYDYVWMGHVHKPQVLKEHPHIAHIGSMDISNFGETEHIKHIVIVDCNEGNFETVPLSTRPLRKLSIAIPKDTEDTTAYVLEEIKKTKLDFNRAIVRVEVSLLTHDLKPINKSVIEKFLTDQGAFNITGITESRKASLIKKSSSSNLNTNMDVSSAIKTYAQTYINTDLHNAFIELAVEIVNIHKAEVK